jgi:predicted XRE-type DNA-binding protein
MKTKRKTTRPLTSLVKKPLLKDEAFQEKVEEIFNGLKVAQQLIKLRKEQGFSQTEFAEMLGVSQPLIAKLESRPLTNIELRKLVRIVTALNGELELRIKSNGAPQKKTLAAGASGHRAP